MAKSKYEYWITDDGLLLLSAWARDGLTDEQIANNMNISTSTFYAWKSKHSVISETLKKGKELVDYEVENALLNKAKGGDITAMIFWLKNRKPRQWRDKPVESSGGTDESLKNMTNLADLLKSPASDRELPPEDSE